MFRLALPLVLAVAVLGGCATPSPNGTEPTMSPSSEPTAPTPSPGPTLPAGAVAIEGRIIEIMPIGTGERRYSLRVPNGGYLAISLPGVPPKSARGVVVAVPRDLELPTDPDALFWALSDLSESTGEPLVVLSFLK